MNNPTHPGDAQASTLIDEFQAATDAGRFLVRWCAECERPHWYPRSICPFCIQSETEWRESEGKGTIYSYTVSPKGDNGQVLAYVALAEGVTLLTAILTDDPDSVSVGQTVEIVRDRNAAGLPLFRTIGAAQQQ